MLCEYRTIYVYIICNHIESVVMLLKYRMIDYVCSKICNLQFAICNFAKNEKLDESKNNYIIYIYYIYNIIKLYILFALRQK